MAGVVYLQLSYSKKLIFRKQPVAADFISLRTRINYEKRQDPGDTYCRYHFIFTY